jgi:hypothetical protein
MRYEGEGEYHEIITIKTDKQISFSRTKYLVVEPRERLQAQHLVAGHLHVELVDDDFVVVGSPKDPVDQVVLFFT